MRTFAAMRRTLHRWNDRVDEALELERTPDVGGKCALWTGRIRGKAGRGPAHSPAMDWTLAYALIGALAVGATLGLMGSGGSILTVPILTYVVGQSEKVAIAGSLAIVGGISIVAAVPYERRGLVDWRSVAWFGLPGMAGAWLGAALSKGVDGSVQLLAFAALMVVAAALMLRQAPQAEPAAARSMRPVLKIAAEGLVVGVVTGFVGVGGGFLIVPALVLLGGLPMNRAVGTSLLVIAVKSFAGFAKYLQVLEELDLHLDWQVVGLFVAAGIAGSFGGAALSSRIPQAALRRGFGLFLLVVAAWVVAQNWPS